MGRWEVAEIWERRFKRFMGRDVRRISKLQNRDERDLTITSNCDEERGRSLPILGPRQREMHYRVQAIEIIERLLGT